MANVAFLGLGVMGYPRAGHLQSAGHSVTVYNRTYAKAEAWVAEHGGAMATTPAEAAQGAPASRWLGDAATVLDRSNRAGGEEEGGQHRQLHADAEEEPPPRHAADTTLAEVEQRVLGGESERQVG